MPKLSGEKVLLHQATQILEDAVAYLSSNGDLMKFASDGTTRKMDVILDPPMPKPLREDHAQFYRMEQERRVVAQKIRENDAKRLELNAEKLNEAALKSGQSQPAPSCSEHYVGLQDAACAESGARQNPCYPCEIAPPSCL